MSTKKKVMGPDGDGVCSESSASESVEVKQPVATDRVFLSDHRGHRLSILRLLNSVTETSSPYNQFTLAQLDKHDITLCSFFTSSLKTPDDVPHFCVDGSISGFLRSFRAAIKARSYDVVHVHSPHLGLFLILGCLLFDRRLLRVSILTVHSSYPNYTFRHRLMLTLDFLVFRRIACCSQASYDSFPRLFRALAGHRIRAIANGADIGRIQGAEEQVTAAGRRSDDDYTVVVVGRLIALKDPLTVLRSFAARHCGKSRLVFVGEGPLQEPLKRAVVEVGLKSYVEFCGLLPREKVYSHLRRADLFVSASTIEGMPIAVLEAMACGCPVILSDIPSHREIAAVADTIPLVEIGNVEGFAREIDRSRRMPKAERAAAGSRCKSIVSDHFSLTKMYRRYEETYDELLPA